MSQLHPIEMGRTVAQVMTTNPIRAEVTSTLQEIADLLFTGDIRHVPIVEKDKLVGIISDRDMRTIAGTFGTTENEQRERLRQSVASYCEADVLSVLPEDDIAEVIDIMLEHKVGAVPVIDEHDHKLVGIVSYIDVLREYREVLR